MKRFLVKKYQVVTTTPINQLVINYKSEIKGAFISLKEYNASIKLPVTENL